MFFSGLPEDIEAATEVPDEDIDYNKQINLSDYGFEHNFWSDAYLNTYGNDSEGVKSRIMYDLEIYSFFNLNLFVFFILYFFYVFSIAIKSSLFTFLIEA